MKYDRLPSILTEVDGGIMLVLYEAGVINLVSHVMGNLRPDAIEPITVSLFRVLAPDSGEVHLLVDQCKKGCIVTMGAGDEF